MITKRFTFEQTAQAAEYLKQGQLVAFPTETVFGLGAIANSERAVASVYQAKGRPSDNPLIVHVCRKEDLFRYSNIVNEAQAAIAKKLTDQFWPGPLTLIVPTKVGIFGPTVTGGLKTVGIRMPDHDFTLAVIRETGFPIVGPSANLSGKPSPTTVDHVLHDFDGKIAGVLDSQPTHIGVESTVLDISNPEELAILRPGAITLKDLRNALPEQRIIDATQQIAEDSKEHPKAPGMKYRHYSPHQEVIAISHDKLLELIASKQGLSPESAVIASDEILSHLDADLPTFSLGTNEATATHLLFAGLRAFDDNDQIKRLYVELLADTEANTAYRNRLLKAASKKIES